MKKILIKNFVVDCLLNLVDNYSSFENVFIDVLNTYAPIKKKVIRSNHAPYATKALRKTIMKRSLLEKI